MPLRKKKLKIKLPSRGEKAPPFPKLLHGAPANTPAIPFPITLPRRRSKFDKYPRIIRIAKSLKSLLKVEPDKPVRMPHFPTLAFPRLYTRYPIMKTYTAVTDIDGKITVIFPRVFRKIPGVLVTPNDPGTWFTHVLSKDEFGFTVQILKTVHKHQHADSGDAGGHGHGDSSGGGGDHDHVIYMSGEHWHNVGGAIIWHKVEGNVWGLASNYTGASAPNTGSPSTSITLVHTILSGTACESGWCVTGTLGGEAAGETHIHTVVSHDHPIPYTNLYFLKDLSFDVIAWTTTQHDGHDHPEEVAGFHYHSIAYEVAHHHVVPDSNEKEASALASTSVTFTYYALEET